MQTRVTTGPNSGFLWKGCTATSGLFLNHGTDQENNAGVGSEIGVVHIERILV
jgi:hypothetical protein